MKSKYDPKYCDFLIDHMSRGYSYESFAANVNTSRYSLYRWEKAHPEWVEAKQIGVEKAMMFWEQLGRAAAMGQVPGYNAATWIFTMKNRFGYRDEQHLTTQNTNINANLQLDGEQSPVIEQLKQKMFQKPEPRDVTPVKIDARRKAKD